MLSNNSSFDIDQMLDNSPQYEPPLFYLINYAHNQDQGANQQMGDLMPIILNQQQQQVDLILSIVCSLLNKEGGILYIGANCSSYEQQTEEDQLNTIKQYFRFLETKIFPYPVGLITIQYITESEKEEQNIDSKIYHLFQYTVKISSESTSYFTFKTFSQVFYNDFDDADKESLLSLQKLDNKSIFIPDLFLKENQRISFSEQVLKLRAFQYFQEEYVCVLNLFNSKKERFEFNLYKFLEINGQQFNFLPMNDHFLFIQCIDCNKISELILQYTISNFFGLNKLTYYQEPLKFGKVRLQMVICPQSTREKSDALLIISNKKCVWHIQQDYLIVFFYHIYDFKSTIKQLYKEGIEYDFYYYQPQIVQINDLVKSMREYSNSLFFKEGEIHSNLSQNELQQNLYYTTTYAQQINYIQNIPLYHFEFFQKGYQGNQFDKHILKLLKATNKSNTLSLF